MVFSVYRNLWRNRVGYHVYLALQQGEGQKLTVEMDSDDATSVQPQIQTMGMARSDLGRGEIPMRLIDHRPFMLSSCEP